MSGKHNFYSALHINIQSLDHLNLGSMLDVQFIEKNYSNAEQIDVITTKANTAKDGVNSLRLFAIKVKILHLVVLNIWTVITKSNDL